MAQKMPQLPNSKLWWKGASIPTLPTLVKNIVLKKGRESMTDLGRALWLSRNFTAPIASLIQKRGRWATKELAFSELVPVPLLSESI
jgi:hypothetical protein